MNFQELTLRWIDEKRMTVKPTTLTYYQYLTEHHLVPLLGQKESLSKPDIAAMAEYCEQRNYCRNTVSGIYSVLKMIVGYGVELGWCDNITITMSTPHQSAKDSLDILSVKEESVLIEHLANRRELLDLGILLGLTSGLRIGEVCGLKVGDINFKKRFCRICRTASLSYDSKLRCTNLVVGTPKTIASRREVPLHASVAKAICAKSKQDPDNYILTGSHSPLNSNQLRTHLARTLRQLHLPSVRFHALRHTFATRCIESGCDVKTLSSILGHSSIQVTLNLYVHPTMQQKENCLNRMMEYLQAYII
ncbi:MAG: site-specific integrase [Prevotella sp.]|nr:site-specific integrase [Prevotella sp.]